MYTEERQEGSQYQATKDKTVKEIASLIRSEIRQATKKEIIPAEWDYSVRLHRFAGGQSIEIHVAVPEEVVSLRYNCPTTTEAWQMLDCLNQTEKFLNDLHESFNYYQSYAPGDGCAMRYFGRASVQRKVSV
jgi:hypothetical protein